jgi:hypothetical protein
MEVYFMPYLRLTYFSSYVNITQLNLSNRSLKTRISKGEKMGFVTRGTSSSHSAAGFGHAPGKSPSVNRWFVFWAIVQALFLAAAAMLSLAYVIGFNNQYPGLTVGTGICLVLAGLTALGLSDNCPVSSAGFYRGLTLFWVGIGFLVIFIGIGTMMQSPH